MNDTQKSGNNCDCMFTVRKAKPEDAEEIAEVLYGTDPFIYPTAFDDLKGARAHFSKLINLEGSAYHYRNIVVATDADENIVGAICYCNDSVDSHLDYYSALSINSEKAKHVCENYFNHLSSNVELPDEYYIVAICVADNFRGKGIGKLLLKNVLSENIAQRFKLDALCNNENAIRLYEKLGFQIVGECYKGYAYSQSKRPDCFCMIRNP